MKQLVRAVLDGGDFLEYHDLWALNLICGFGRIGGRVVGVVANQPQVLAGVLDIDAAEKGARFVRTCDCFNIPVVTFVDVPVSCRGPTRSTAGLARRAAKLLYAYCEATVPKIQVIIRKAYGAGYVVMSSKSLGADFAFGWPSAELAVMGPKAPLISSTLASSPVPRPNGGRNWSSSTARTTPTRTWPPNAATSTTSSTPPTPGACWPRASRFWPRSAKSPPARKHGNVPL